MMFQHKKGNAAEAAAENSQLNQLKQSNLAVLLFFLSAKVDPILFQKNYYYDNEIV